MEDKCVSTTRYTLWRNKDAVRLRLPRHCTRIGIIDTRGATSDKLTCTSDVMFSDKLLMIFCQIWCWLGCCLFSTFYLI